METMKSEWRASRLEVQVFAPNEFVAACQGYDDAFTATCKSGSCLVFFDGVSGESGNGDYISDACRGGCGKSHVFRASDGVDLTTLRTGNCWLLLKVSTDTRYGSDNTSEYIERGWITRSGNGYKIPDNMVDVLKSSNELVRGYYNSECLGGSVLVTDELQKIVPAS